MYISQLEVCLKRAIDFRRNLVNLKVKRLKLTEALKVTILCFFSNLVNFEKIKFIVFICDHRRTIRLKYLILIK